MRWPWRCSRRGDSLALRGAAMRASTAGLLLLAACAPLPYAEPAGEEIATLRIENQSPAVFGYELEAIAYEDANACAGKRRVASTRELVRGVPHTLRVAADADFTLTLRASGGGASRGDSCTLAGTFRPARGERYAA